MGAITRSLGNNITTGGVILPAGITNSSVSAVTAFSGYTTGGTLKLLSTQTANNSATISFTSGLNSTYDAYEFHFIDIHPRTNAVGFEFNLSTDGGSNYNVTKTSTYFQAFHSENDAFAGLSYDTPNDLAQSTAFQRIMKTMSSDADSNGNGILQLFNPASTVYVKHFIARTSYMRTDPNEDDAFIAGYGNTTSAVNAIRFQMSSGNFDGDIKLYGVKKS